MRTGELGFWWHSLPAPPAPRESLRGVIEADVAIVGAGYTGLWTAYYLKRAQPSLRVVIVDAQRAGFGASGRNGGWVSGFFSGPARVYERSGGRAALARLQRTMFATVEEIEQILQRERIDADFVKSGQLDAALDRAQAQRLSEHVRALHALGFGEHDLRVLDRDQLAARVRVAGAQLGSFSPHVARVHPMKLVCGLAAAVERAGVTLYERTPIREIRPGEARGDGVSVRARWIVRATEGYTSSLRGLRRALVPMNSSMIVTEPLPASIWGRIGWEGSELLGDGAHVFAYLQRTVDGRIAIGGRGVPYRFASRNDGDGRTARVTVTQLHRKLVELFPEIAGVQIEHAWSGVLGVARDWSVSVDADRRQGSPGRAVMSARTSPRRTSPGARCATCCSTSPARCGSCRGSGAGRAAGSPSRCAGRRSAAFTRCIAAPTRSSAAAVASHASARVSTCCPAATEGA